MCVYSVHFYHSTFKSSVFSKRGRSWGWVQIGTHGHSWTWPQKPLSGVESITGSGSKSQATKPAGSTPPKPHSCSQNTATGAVVLSWHSQRWMSVKLCGNHVKLHWHVVVTDQSNPWFWFVIFYRTIFLEMYTHHPANSFSSLSKVCWGDSWLKVFVVQWFDPINRSWIQFNSFQLIECN